jgi:hypothetical protein
MPTGYVIYNGPSELDGAPVVAVATGFGNGNSNPKLGSRLIQVWILRADMSPVEAVLTSADSSVCGTCALRGTAVDRRVTDRTCYVPVFLAPLSVWNAYMRSEAEPGPGSHETSKRILYGRVEGDQVEGLFAGYGVRLGSYGDPAALPPSIWEAVTARAGFWTGYTHHWRECDPIFAKWCMASCETETDRLRAQAMGYRTFRTTMLDARADRLKREIVCPGSAEGGHKTTCEVCRICGGNGSAGQKPDVVITMHGVASRRIQNRK